MAFTGKRPRSKAGSNPPGRRRRGPPRPAVFEAPLQPQDLVLDLIGWYLLPRGGLAWSGGLVRLLSELGFSVPAARVALGRLVRRRLLTPVREKRLVFYAPAARLETVLAEGLRRIRTFGQDEPWDGLWTVLWYAIPGRQKIQQRRLARRLRFLGFGSPQEGMWITPRDREVQVLAIARELGLGDHVTVLVGRMSAGIDLRRLVARVWDLRELDRRYENFIESYSRFRTADAAAAIPDSEAFLMCTRAVAEFRRFPALDPSLPAEIVGDSWKRDDAVSTFRDLEAALRPAALRHFATANEPPLPAARKQRK